MDETAISLNVDAIEAWLSKLPISNTPEACRLLFEGLKALTHTESEPTGLFHAIEKFRPLVFLMSRKLLTFGLGKPFPLEAKVRKLVRLSAEFHGELAKGYLRVITTEGFKDSFNREVRARIYFRCLRSLEIYVQRVSLFYEMPSSSVWEKIAFVHILVNRESMHSASDGESPPENPAFTIAGVLSRLMLLRMTSPSRLSQDEMERIYSLLDQSAHLIRLGSSIDDRNEADFAVLPDSIDPPIPLSDAKSLPGKPLFLGIRALVQKLNTMAQGSAHDSDRLADSLVTYLRVRWGASPKVPGDQKPRSVTLTLGFDAVHQCAAEITGGLGQETSWASPATLRILKPDEQDSDRWSSFQSSKSAGSFRAFGQRPASDDSDPFNPQDIPGSGQVSGNLFRAEATGFYVFEPIGRMQSGYSLAGINTDNTLLQVGIIRPIRGNASSVRYYSFELLQNQAKPVRLRCERSYLETRKATISRSLTGRSWMVITAPFRPQPGEGVLVETDVGKQRCLVAKIIETTNEFIQLELISDPDNP